MNKIKGSGASAFLFIALIVFVFNIGCKNQIHYNTADQQCIDTLKKFYIDYNAEWSSGDKGFTLQKKIYALRKKICTPKFLKLMGDDLDFDPLIDNAGTDIAHLNTLSVKKDMTKTDVYIVSYSSPYLNRPEVTYLKAVQEKGMCKIDSAWEAGNY